jgi:hypothetical protein
LLLDVDAPCAHCGIEPNRLSDQFCSDFCQEAAGGPVTGALTTNGGLAPSAAALIPRERPRVVRLVVVQSDVEKADDDATLAAAFKPQIRGDCGPTACPGCGHPVLMRVKDFGDDEPLVVSCPDCLMLLVPAKAERAWEWASIFRSDAEMPEPLAYQQAMNHCRPCPWVSCTHHLYLDVLDRGSIRFNFPSKEPWEMTESCTLDVAERDGATLDEVGKTINITRERVRQLIEQALRAGKKACNPIFKGHLDIEDVNDLPDLRHPLSDVE